MTTGFYLSKRVWVQLTLHGCLFLFFFLASCSSPVMVRQESDPESEMFEPDPEPPIASEIFRDMPGFVMLEPNDALENEPVRIIDSAGNASFIIDLKTNQFTDSAKSYPIFINGTVNPSVAEMLNILEIAPEYRLFHFTCTRESDNYFEICTDECYQVFRFISKQHPAVRFLTAGEYVRAGFVRPKDRKIHPQPGKARPSYNTGGNFYKVEELQGDWALVDCLATGCDCQYDQHNQKGWIRWRQGQKFLVEFAWLCEGQEQVGQTH